MNKIAILYPYGFMRSFQAEGAVRRFLSGPDNIGNKIYIDLLAGIFPGADLITAQQIIENPVEMRERYGKIVFPMSNMISPFYSSQLSSVVDEHDLNIVLLSVGVQAPLHSHLDEITISADALSLLKSASRKGNIVGARGVATSFLLNRYEIPNKVIGCPSLLGVKSVRRPAADRVCVNATLSGYHRWKTANLIAFAVKYADGYALQDEARIIRDVFGIDCDAIDMLDLESPYGKELENKLFDYGYYNSGEYEWGAVRDFFRKKAFFHVEVRDWVSALSGFGISVGMRLHGNVAALMAGTPALFIPCDLRTRELIDYHALPSVSDIDTNSSIGALLESARYDRFFDAWTDRKNNFLAFLEDVGLHDYLSDNPLA